jgi:hypothetical protein
MFRTIEALYFGEKHMSILIVEEPINKLILENQQLKEQVGNVRRGLFARHSELEKKYNNLAHEFEQLKQAIINQEKTWTLKSSSTIRTKKKSKENLDFLPDLFTFSS